MIKREPIFQSTTSDTISVENALRERGEVSFLEEGKIEMTLSKS
jgi:hypothetical protein